MAQWRRICLLLVMAFSSEAMEAASQAARVFASGVMPALLPMMVLCRLLPARANHERSPWREPCRRGALFLCLRLAGQRAARARPLRRRRGGPRRDGAAPGRLRGDEPHVFHRHPGSVDGAARGLPGAASVSLGGRAGRRRAGEAGVGASAGGARRRRRDAAAACARRASLPAGGRDGSSHIASGGMRRDDDLCRRRGRASRLGCGALARPGRRHTGRCWRRHGRCWRSAAARRRCWKHGRRPPMALLCALCSFGGLSIWLQNLLFVPECVRPAKLLCMRMLHGALSGGLALLIFTLFPGLTRPF